MSAASVMLGPSPLTAAAVWAPLSPSSREAVRDRLLRVGALARRRAAVELDLARILAWLRHRDPVELGHVTWSAFSGERVDWQGSWLRDMVRLVESPLLLVQRAAAEGVLPLRLAVRAPGNVAVENQAAWILAAVLGPADAERKEHDVFAGKEAETIRRARHLARLLLGHAPPPAEVDAQILRWWRDRVPAEQLLAEARTPPSAPQPAPPPTWEDWSAPRSVSEALTRMDALQATLRGMTTVLARAWARISHERLYARAGYATAAECALEVLQMSLRSAQRLARLGWGLEWFPEVDAAVQAGLSPYTAAHLLQAAGDDAVDWLALAARVGRRELERATSDAREQWAGRPTLTRYRKAIEIADRWAATPAGAALLAEAPVAEATSAGGGNPPPLRVAILRGKPERFSGAPLHAPPGMADAAAWLLDTVKLPVLHGFAAVREASDHRRTNPECGRRSLRTESHHLVARSAGGSDDRENGAGACRMCHVRGVHGGRLRVQRVVIEGHDTLLWAWPGGKRALLFRDEPGRPTVQ